LRLSSKATAFGCAKARHDGLEILMIKLKRAYDAPARGDGMRFLVERLWPRGIRKADLPLDGWLKDVAPSAELRRWFAHDPRKWSEFQRRYRLELRRNASYLEPLVAAARKGPTTLVYSARDTEHNAAVVLRDYLATGKDRP
jgi:uncharacterized protein YeaO (DUF488 family)